MNNDSLLPIHFKFSLLEFICLRNRFLFYDDGNVFAWFCPTGCIRKRQLAVWVLVNFCMLFGQLICWSIKETVFLGITQQQLESLFSWRRDHFTLKFVPFMNNTSFFMSYSKIKLFDVPFAHIQPALVVWKRWCRAKAKKPRFKG